MSSENTKNAPVIAGLMGRLGNCLFQIANGKSYAKRTNRDFCIYFDDCQPNNRSFDEILKRFEKIESLPDNKVEWREGKNHIYKEIPDFDKDKPVVFHGYFQHPKYFKREDVLEWFKEPDGIKEKIFEKYGDLTDCVHISVRRGDYVRLGIAPEAEWYNDVYHNNFDGKKAFVCSDDIDWCKENLNIKNIIFSDHTSVMEDLYGGSYCKDHICYNGTFGFWSSYLGEKPDSKIIVKSGLFKTLPDKWIEM